MREVLAGVRVVEVAAWTFVPAAGAALADQGADVIKVEHPVGGDPQRGLVTRALAGAGPDILTEQANRGKRSVGVDIATPEGREVLLRLVEQADVFLTNFLPDARQRLGIDVEDVRARNPRIIYVRGTGQGPEGPDAAKGGFDLASAWCRAGIGWKFTTPERSEPMPQPTAFIDLMGGITLAGAVSSALFHRERTGEPTVVDVSLLSVGAWVLSPDIVAAPWIDQFPVPYREEATNPLVNPYRTADDRWIWLVFLQSDRYWADLCHHLGRPDLAADERYGSASSRYAHRHRCREELERIFASRPLAEWREVLDEVDGVWSVLQTPGEVHDDRQVRANGYVLEVEGAPDEKLRLVDSPMRFDGRREVLPRAPEAFEHTEEVLLELGCTWGDIVDLKDKGAVA